MHCCWSFFFISFQETNMQAVIKLSINCVKVFNCMLAPPSDRWLSGIFLLVRFFKKNVSHQVIPLLIVCTPGLVFILLQNKNWILAHNEDINLEVVAAMQWLKKKKKKKRKANNTLWKKGRRCFLLKEIVDREYVSLNQSCQLRLKRKRKKESDEDT